MQVEPAEHFVNWQQDPFSNYLGRLVFPKKTKELKVTVDLVVEMSVYNPFDFFLTPSAEKYPFNYTRSAEIELAPYLVTERLTPLLKKYYRTIDRSSMRTIDFLVHINQRLFDYDRIIICGPVFPHVVVGGRWALLRARGHRRGPAR